MSSAPQAAWTTRAATSAHTSGATAHAAEATPKIAHPGEERGAAADQVDHGEAGTSSAANTIA